MRNQIWIAILIGLLGLLFIQPQLIESEVKLTALECKRFINYLYEADMRREIVPLNNAQIVQLNLLWDNGGCTEKDILDMLRPRRVAPMFSRILYTIMSVLQAIDPLAPGDFPWEDIFAPWLADLAYTIADVIEAIIHALGI